MIRSRKIGLQTLTMPRLDNRGHMVGIIHNTVLRFHFLREINQPADHHGSFSSIIKKIYPDGYPFLDDKCVGR